MTQLTENQLETPVAFFIYRRASLTAKSFAAISEVRPKRLYVIADGPKNDAEKEKCDQARSVVEQITWPCEIKKNYAETNLGCARRIISGLDWVFAQEPEAIILEDDVVAGKSFFYFCQELLAKYRNDDRIFQISGSNFQHHNKQFVCKDSYYFSRITASCGWATWARAWKLYDFNISFWPAFRASNEINGLFSDQNISAFVKKFHDQLYRDIKYQPGFDFWDPQWRLAALFYNKLVIRPSVNLVTNIGTDSDSTHTIGDFLTANIPLDVMSFPLRHPLELAINHDADEHLFQYRPRLRSLVEKIKLFLWYEFSNKST